MSDNLDVQKIVNAKMLEIIKILPPGNKVPKNYETLVDANVAIVAMILRIAHQDDDVLPGMFYSELDDVIAAWAELLSSDPELHKLPIMEVTASILRVVMSQMTAMLLKEKASDLDAYIKTNRRIREGYARYLIKTGKAPASETDPPPVVGLPTLQKIREEHPELDQHFKDLYAGARRYADNDVYDDNFHRTIMDISAAIRELYANHVGWWVTLTLYKELTRVMVGVAVVEHLHPGAGPQVIEARQDALETLMEFVHRRESKYT